MNELDRTIRGSILRGATGAAQIGITAITGVTGTKIQAALESLKSLIDAKAAKGSPTAGTYTLSTITVNSEGVVTSASSGSPGAVLDASTAQKGVSKSSAAPADSANPVHIESTDAKMSEGTAGTATVRSLGTTATQAAAGNHTHSNPAYYKWFHSGSTAATVTGKGWERVLESRTLNEIGVEFDVAPTVSTTVAILRRSSGGAASQIATVSITANSKVGSATGLSISLSAGDGMRVDVTSGGTTGSDMFVVAKAS